jgi:alpha-galactosidase
MVKISIIGAGSANWSLKLIKDICLTKGLWKSKVCLMDINKERLELVYILAKRYAKAVKTDLKFERTLSRKHALKEADFIITSVMTPGHSSYELQRSVAEKHGYYRGIDSVDHNMVSDYYTIGGYNQMKLFMDIATDIKDICPNAWIIQTSNPLFELCTLLNRKFNLKIIGVCHGHLGYKEVIRILRLNPEDVEVEMIGVNHYIWLTLFRYKGKDAYPLLDEWIKNKAEQFWEHRKPNYFENDMSPAAIDMYKRFGLLPIGDSVRSGGWKYHFNLKTKKKWYGPLGGFDSEIGWKLYLKDLEEGLNKIARLVNAAKAELLKEIPPVMSEEQHIPIINSIVNDIPSIYQVNIPNQGVIRGIREDVVVEVPVKVNAKGIHRLSVHQLTQDVMRYALLPRILRMEWALDAFLKGGRNKLLEWLMNDIRTRSISQAEKAIKAILALPFNKEMAKHYN